MSKKKIVMLVLTVLVISVLSANSQPTISVSGTIRVPCSKCNFTILPIYQHFNVVLKTADDVTVGQKNGLKYFYLTKPNNIVSDVIPYEIGTTPVKALVYITTTPTTVNLTGDQLIIKFGNNDHVCPPTIGIPTLPTTPIIN